MSKKSQKVKPIETVYNGYKFRSRLEARWAVFFDALGIEWEYEPEGYDLGEHGRYLPDFRVDFAGLPIFFEIKPKKAFLPTLFPESVYLAGKVDRIPVESKEVNWGGYPIIEEAYGEDWRHEIADKDALNCKYPFTTINPDSHFFKTGFIYTGPHYDDNHGCCIEHAHSRALTEIGKADIVFAWIDTHDSFGTLAEIGYAASPAFNKIILIGYHSSVDKNDLRFISRFAHKHGVYEGPKEAWEDLVGNPFDRACTEEKKIAALPEKFPVYVAMDDPLRVELFIYRDSSCGYANLNALLAVKGISSDEIEMAKLKAVQARFEHGEPLQVRRFEHAF